MFIKFTFINMLAMLETQQSVHCEKHIQFVAPAMLFVCSTVIMKEE